MGFDLGSFAGSALSGLMGFAGGSINATTSKSIAREQMRLQKEFAQNGIQWKVADAKAAGLHPLYAIGANTATYTPVSQDSSAMGNAVADAGAYLGKAVDGAIDRATQKAIEQENLDFQRKMQFNQLALARENLRGKILDNDYAEQQMVNSLRAQGSGNPAHPIAVSTPMGEFFVNNPDQKRYTSKVGSNGATALAGVNLKPNDVTMSSPGSPAQGAGANPDYDLVRTPDGYKKIMSQAFADRTDDDVLAKIGWHLRHDAADFLSSWGAWSAPRDLDLRAYPLPKGSPFDVRRWRFHPIYLEYMPYSDLRGRYWSDNRKLWLK